MDAESKSPHPTGNSGGSFLRLVLILFLAIVAALVVFQFMGDNSGTLDFDYGGFG